MPETQIHLHRNTEERRSHRLFSQRKLWLTTIGNQSFFFGLLLAVVAVFSPQAGAQEDKLPFPIPKSGRELPQSAVVETNKGRFEIEFFTEDAPITVRNFEYLANKGFYKNLIFHRYEPGFVIQGGDPKGNGKGGAGYLLPPEFSERPHRPGTLGMARLPDQANVERLSNGSQFYITLMRARHLDGLYTVFAQVTRGMETVEKLRRGDRILRITISPRSGSR